MGTVDPYLIDPLGTPERRVATAFSQLDPEWAVHVQPRLTMDVPDLLHMFEKVRGEKLADDALLLG